MKIFNAIMSINPMGGNNTDYLAGHRACRHRAANVAAKQDAVMVRVLSALETALMALEEHEVMSEEMFGCGRSLDELEADGDLPWPIQKARQMLKEAKA